MCIYGLLKVPSLIHIVEAQMQVLLGLHVMYKGEETVVWLIRACEVIGDCGVVGRVEQCWSNILVSAFICLALIFDVNYRISGISLHYFCRTTPA